MKTVMSLDEARRAALASGAQLEVGGRVFNASRKQGVSQKAPPIPPPVAGSETALADVLKSQTAVLSAMLERLAAPKPAEPEPAPQPVRQPLTLVAGFEYEPPAKPQIPLSQRVGRRYEITAEHEEGRLLSAHVLRNGLAAYDALVERDGEQVSQVTVMREGRPRYRMVPTMDGAIITKLLIHSI